MHQVNCRLMPAFGLVKSLSKTKGGIERTPPRRTPNLRVVRRFPPGPESFSDFSPSLCLFASLPLEASNRYIERRPVTFCLLVGPTVEMRLDG